MKEEEKRRGEKQDKKKKKRIVKTAVRIEDGRREWARADKDMREKR